MPTEELIQARAEIERLNKALANAGEEVVEWMNKHTAAVRLVEEMRRLAAKRPDAERVASEILATGDDTDPGALAATLADAADWLDQHATLKFGPRLRAAARLLLNESFRASAMPAAEICEVVRLRAENERLSGVWEKLGEAASRLAKAEERIRDQEGAIREHLRIIGEMGAKLPKADRIGELEKLWADAHERECFQQRRAEEVEKDRDEARAALKQIAEGGTVISGATGEQRKEPIEARVAQSIARTALKAEEP